MTIELVKNELKRFLADPTPEVLAIRGQWGVGKTYAWNQILNQINRCETISKQRYVYLSLFGIGSLDELKFSLFEHSVPKKLIGKEPTIETFRQNTAQLSESLGRKATNSISKFPLIKNFAPAFDALPFFSIRDTLVCLDDLERKSSGLCLRDVLGLASLLKEQRNCKIVLLLNDQEDEAKAFKTYQEKVVDIELAFEPTPEECAKIAFSDSSPVCAKISEFSQKLGIKNIRTLKKIERLVGLVEDRLTDYEPEITHQVLHSLTLYGSCRYRSQDDSVPPLPYVKNIGHALFGLEDKDDLSEDEKSWNMLLRDYGYSTADGLDEVLVQAVSTGFIDGAAFERAAREKNEQIVASKSRSSFTEAWHTYHDSFDNDEENVISTLWSSFRENVMQISPINLDGTVTLFRELGRDTEADDLISFYIEARADEDDLFNLDNVFNFNEIRDNSVREAFESAHSRSIAREPAEDVLKRLNMNNGWNERDEAVLADTSPDEYYAIFKNHHGDKLCEMVNTALKFGQFSNANERQLKIANNATAALRRIGSESRINALRVRKFGIGQHGVGPR